MKGPVELLSAGAGKVAAIIEASFPENSVCTCTDGEKTLKAKSTEGKWLFTLPHAGRWTVSATDGTESASKEVELGEGQSARVSLEYKDFVIHDGVLNEGYTIDVGTSATYELVDGALVFRSTKSSSGNGNVLINRNGQPIDFSTRSTLKFDTEATSPRAGLQDKVTWSIQNNYSAQVTKDLGVNDPVERQIVPLDISNIASGTIRLFISDIWGTVALKIYDAWFE